MAGRRVRLPPAAERVWEWFWRLDRTRNGNGYGPNRLTYVDIRSAFGDRPEEWETLALLLMDDVRIGLWVKESGAEPSERAVSQRELSTELFDALWS